MLWLMLLLGCINPPEPDVLGTEPVYCPRVEFCSLGDSFWGDLSWSLWFDGTTLEGDTFANAFMVEGFKCSFVNAVNMSQATWASYMDNFNTENEVFTTYVVQLRSPSELYQECTVSGIAAKFLLEKDQISCLPPTPESEIPQPDEMLPCLH